MYKVKHKIAPKLMCELFQVTEHPYNSRNDYTSRTYKVNPLMPGGKKKVTHT